MDLNTKLAQLEWVVPKQAKLLEKFGLCTLRDLVTHYPRRHEDRRQFDSFPSVESDKPVCVCGIVAKISVKRLPGWKKLVEVVLQEEDAHALSGMLICRWFNAHFVQKMIATGQKLVVYGKPKLRAKKIYIDHPEFEVVENDEEVSIHLKRITPVYRATEGLSQRVLRTLLFRAMKHLDGINEKLPAQLNPLPDWNLGRAIQQIHFPSSWEDFAKAREYLVLDEFFEMQLFLAARKREVSVLPGKSHCGPGRLLARFYDELSFPLTNAQKRAVEEIRHDLAAPVPMNRLLHGDVGSGKTVVALSSLLLAVEAGFQGALMAPTQILAEQHYLNFCRWLHPLGVRVALRTGNRKENSALPLFDASVADWNGETRLGEEPQIVVGTHALLYEAEKFSNLGLVVIDEQHKFGVLQRARLMQQGDVPDVLVMTATPIPRTLTMTIYGDLEVSVLDELPANRGKIITAVREPSKLPEAIQFINGHLEKGRQAYIVYPLIDESSAVEAKAAAAEFERWKKWLTPKTCELLHGRIDPEEKERIMQRFRSGEIDVLVATTVIEVGIDVPNANIMLIENAERFGLAQLHQLRGRIGRGKHKSYCILLTSKPSEEAMQKLQTLERTSDGFEVAEADLTLRGPGDILGTAQSGLPPLKLGDILKDANLMQRARKVALEIFNEDPGFLDRKENKRFRSSIVENRKLILSQVS